MIRRLRSPEEAMPFVRRLLEGGFCAPMLETPEQLQRNLLGGFDHPQDFVLGCEEDGRLTGVFSLMAEPEERYLEMMLALSEDEKACEETLSFLGQQVPGYTLDCVIHPSCAAMRRVWEAAGGVWEPVQQKLRLIRSTAAAAPCRILPCSEENRAGYVAMHSTDCYWTAQRVLAAPERFVAYTAVLDGKVVGYLDVTKGFEENEVYDWQVQPEYRGRGLGTGLLSEAVRCNGGSGMILLCGEDEQAARRAAQKAGFAAVQGAQSIAGRMILQPRT